MKAQYAQRKGKNRHWVAIKVRTNSIKMGSRIIEWTNIDALNSC